VSRSQPPSDSALRVVVADDDPFARRLIRSALEHAGMLVVGRDHAGLDGVLATRTILKALPHQLVLMLTRGGEDEFGLLALQAGAVGFLSKETDIDAVPRALEGVHSGEAAISRAMTRRLIERLRNAPRGRSGQRPVKGPLTSRDWEVVDLLAPGHSPPGSPTRSSSPPKPCARTSRTSCASSMFTHARTPSQPLNDCASPRQRQLLGHT
jgi:CheY-like chemotaxis protein